MSRRKSKKNKSHQQHVNVVNVSPINKPLIGVVDGWSVANIIESMGAVAYTIDDVHDVENAMPFLDGILFTGGGDINPALYGVQEEDVHKEVYGISESRDAKELPLLKQAMRDGLGIMGICRGSQLINVAHGGTLHQHIEGPLNTHSHWGVMHDVKLSRTSQLRSTLKTNVLSLVSSYHHQAVDQLGDGLVPIGWHYDGTIEAIETTRDQAHYALGVQFHPEMDYRTDKDAVAIFKHFIEMCRGRNKMGTSATQREAELSDLTYKLRPAPIPQPITYKYGGKSGSTVYDSWGCDAKFQGKSPASRNDWEWDDTEISHDWWDMERREWVKEGSYIGSEDDTFAYEDWLRANDTSLTAYGKQQVCDTMCAFPPCARPGECDADEGDCFSMRVAEGTTGAQILALKRGNPRGGSK